MHFFKDSGLRNRITLSALRFQGMSSPAQGEIPDAFALFEANCGYLNVQEDAQLFLFRSFLYELS